MFHLLTEYRVPACVSSTGSPGSEIRINKTEISFSGFSLVILNPDREKVLLLPKTKRTDKNTQNSIRTWIRTWEAFSQLQLVSCKSIKNKVLSEIIKNMMVHLLRTKMKLSLSRRSQSPKPMMRTPSSWKINKNRPQESCLTLKKTY